MNKHAIQKYAVWARNELIEQVKQRAYQYGIDDKGYGDANAATIAGRVLSADEKQQRREFVSQIDGNGYQQVIEEVAYTWFNRFVALRFMEVNDYLPTHVRVFSDANGDFNPEILKEVLHLDLPGLDRSKVSELLNANQTEDLYRYLLLTQCNALHAALPEMFEKLGSYTEMLLPNNILKPDGVLGRLVADIPREDWLDAVQIIGWMYQYYITEKHNAVVDVLAKAIVKPEDIPAATQLFTPDWIVRYMVENSLGRLWLESHPNGALKASWEYYLDEAEETPEVAEKLRIMRSQSPVKSPEDIRLIDPCMGSGHILVYAFDVLMKIYESEGHNPRDAAKLILEKNIYGLDIDRRAYQLAYFSLMMKARQYNRRILTDGIKPQVYHPAGFSDGEEYGSIANVEVLPPKPEEPRELTLFTEKYETTINAWNFKRLLTQKYDVVVTNPPYLNRYSGALKEYVQRSYADFAVDLYAVFIKRSLQLCVDGGYAALMTPNSWMFLVSSEKLRRDIMSNYHISTFVHIAKGSFFKEATVDICTFVLQNTNKRDVGRFVSLEKYKNNMEAQQEGLQQEVLQLRNGYDVSQTKLLTLPANILAYWASDHVFNAFQQISLYEYTVSDGQNKTGNNDRYLRYFWEVSGSTVGANKKWVLCAKGGPYRKWYGNVIDTIDWSPETRLFYRKDHVARIMPEYLWYKPCITWSNITSYKASFRVVEEGMLFEMKGTSVFAKNSNNYLLIIAFLNSVVTEHLLSMITQAITFQLRDIRNLPFIMASDSQKQRISDIASRCISISRTDWDSFETSWDFKRHPLLCGERTIAAAFGKWEREAAERFDALKTNEEALNRIFIDIYGLQHELTPEVNDKDVTVRRADLGREIRSLISYAVGCIFGRYSLDVEGLAYTGGDWDPSKYRTLIPDKDSILPICDDEYFDDDIVGRFVEFVRVVYGAETLEENLKFIVDALGGKGTPRVVLRDYFLNDFYNDHCKIYQKRPIYWLFDSGKKNGFKALTYLHRYSRDLLAKLRTDYVHEQQERYRTQLSHISTALNAATGAERARLLRRQDKLTEQLREIGAYEERVHHLADMNIEIDLDDGVKKNYEIFTDVLAKI